MVLEWAAGNIVPPEPEPGADAPEPITRKAALLSAWQQARAGTPIVHIAGTQRAVTENAEELVRKYAIHFYSTDDSVDAAWKAFKGQFQNTLIEELTMSGLAPVTALKMIEQVIANMERGAWEALKQSVEKTSGS